MEYVDYEIIEYIIPFSFKK